MKCKFCLQEKNLIEAHIIPHSFFKPILEEIKPGLFHADPKRFKKRAPKGVYDKNLVCEKCEQQWSDYDNYAKIFLLDELKSKLMEHPDAPGLAFSVPVAGFDYNKLKLFFISLLWRASASNEEFYKRVNVGTFEGRLKEMVKNHEPGQPEEFPIIFKIFQGPGADKQIMSPTREEIEGHNYYRFYLAGICAQISVDIQPLKPELENYILKPDQPLVLCRQNILESNELKGFYKERNKMRAKNGSV